MAQDKKENDSPKYKPEQVFVVLHSAVGGFFAGQRVTHEHLKGGFDREIDLDRLVGLGAIVPVDSDAGRAKLADIAPDETTPGNQKVNDPVPLPTPDAGKPGDPSLATGSPK